MLRFKVSDKAQHYIDLLDTARCNGNWKKIPELTRKILKHAPDRQCLVATARVERASADDAAAGRPVSSPPIAILLHDLHQGLDDEKKFKEDVFQAMVSRAWVCLAENHYAEALSMLRMNLENILDYLEEDGPVTMRWTHVCIIKAAYIRGHALESKAQEPSAIEAYRGMLPYLTDPSPIHSNTTAHRAWTWNFLSRYCVLISRYVIFTTGNPLSILSMTSFMPPEVILPSFHLFAQLFNAKTPVTFDPHVVSASLTQVAASFYEMFSLLFQAKTVQPIFESRLHQLQELKKAEGLYDGILFKETQFPKAGEINIEWENFVDEVMANWRIATSRSWRDADLLEGGRTGLDKGVLEIFYHAGERTFQSVRVLRHLRTMHASLTEFSLADATLKRYLEVTIKARSRIDQSGTARENVDDEAMEFITAASGIKMLCRYGGQDDIERILEISSTVETWLARIHPDGPPQSSKSAHELSEELSQWSTNPHKIGPKAGLVHGYFAVGISRFQQAQLTPDSEKRSAIFQEAVDFLQLSISPWFGLENNPGLLHAFARVNAGIRDTDTAIVAVKQALVTSKPTRLSPGFYIDYRDVYLRCWHLLALLLSTEATPYSYSKAIESCEAGLDLYGSKGILYGNVDFLDSVTGLSLVEKKSIVEVKITHLAILKLKKGALAAVDSSEQLLALYAKLFKYAEERPVTPKIHGNLSLAPPSTPNGTLRSFRGSILGLPLHRGAQGKKKETSTQTTVQSQHSIHDFSKVFSTSNQVTASATNAESRLSTMIRPGSKRLQKRSSHIETTPTKRPSTSESSTQQPLNLSLPHRKTQSTALIMDTPSGRISPEVTPQFNADEVGIAISHDLPSIPSSPTYVPQTPKSLQSGSPPHYSIPQPVKAPAERPPSPVKAAPCSPIGPDPHFSRQDEERHALTLLVKIWLVIVVLYREANMLEEAEKALEEATKTVKRIETSIVAGEGGSAANFAKRGLGGVKSLNELHADVLGVQAEMFEEQGKTAKAKETYQKALGYFPDHVDATIGFAKMLLDEYKAATKEKMKPSTEKPLQLPPVLSTLPSPKKSPNTNRRFSFFSSKDPSDDDKDRIAARDHAHGLLSRLTQSGTGWDCGEAWALMADVHEASGMKDQAIAANEWVVELETERPVRPYGEAT